MEASSKIKHTQNWKIEISGANFHDRNIFLEGYFKKVDIEERVYKFRCVEAWSMVVSGQGFELSKLIKILKPKI